MSPSIGRIVHYKNGQGIVWPAIITNYDLPTKRLTLTVFGDFTTTPGVKSDSMAEGPRQAEMGQWWWPERV